MDYYATCTSLDLSDRFFLFSLTISLAVVRYPLESLKLDGRQFFGWPIETIQLISKKNVYTINAKHRNRWDTRFIIVSVWIC